MSRTLAQPAALIDDDDEAQSVAIGDPDALDKPQNVKAIDTAIKRLRRLAKILERDLVDGRKVWGDLSLRIVVSDGLFGESFGRIDTRDRPYTPGRAK